MGKEFLMSEELTVAEDGRVIVVSFDPGVSTGWVYSVFDRVTLFDEESSLMRRLRTGEWVVGDITREQVIGVAESSGSPGSSAVAVGKDWSGRVLDSAVRHRALSSVEGWDSFTARSMVEICRAAWEAASVDPELDVFAVVQEDFILRTQDAARHTLAPVRVNAAFDVLLEGGGSSGVKKVKFSASDAKNVVTDERLKRWHLYDLAGGSRHRRDALRHNILFLRKWTTEPAFRVRFEV